MKNKINKMIRLFCDQWAALCSHGIVAKCEAAICFLLMRIQHTLVRCVIEPGEPIDALQVTRETSKK